MIMLSFLFSVSVPSTLIVVLAFFILNTPGVFALSSLTSEPHRRSPLLAIMATLSPLAVTGYSFLAIGLSYTLLRLFFILKPRLLSSTVTTALPQPVSAGRTSAFSFRSPFSSFRYRQKSTTVKPTRARSRWSPLSAFYRRLTRPSAPLHLSETDGLPTVMPDSSSATHSLLDLPVMSRSSPMAVAKNHGHIFETRQISRSSSMDALPSYKPLTPVYVQAPVVSRTASSPPATPSPSTPKFLPGVEDEDIPLIPITPPKYRSTPETTRNACGLFTPPPTTGSFPAISLSPFKANNSTFVQSANAVAGTRPTDPRPNLLLASRTLSSLSLSPRSQALQQSRRNKGLGGVAVKRISPSHSYFDQQESGSESSQDVTTGGMTVESEKEANQNSTQLVSLVASPPRFLLNFSSLPSSPTSDCSSTMGLLSPSPSPSTSNSDTAPSIPLTASPAASQFSNSSDIAKPLENNPFLPRPIPLVDVDTDVYTDTSGMLGFDWKVPEWSFDAEEPGNIELLFDGPSSKGDIFGSPAKRISNELEKELIEIEDENEKSDLPQQQGGESGWGWNDEPEEQGCRDVEVHAETCVERIGQDLQDDEAVLNDQNECEDRDVIDRVELSVDYELEEDIEYPDPDLLPLPETIDVLPSIFTEAGNMPVISICTQPSVTCRDPCSDDSDDSSGSSLSDAASPISLVQTPTPPASPPREARVVSLLKPAIANDLDNDGWTATPVISAVSESLGTVDVELLKDRFRASSLPLVDTEMNSSATDEADVSITVDSGVDEDESHFFEDQRFFCSPECTTQALPVNSDDEIGDEVTLNVELASDVGGSDDGHGYDEMDMTLTAPLPYGLGDVPGEGADGKEEVLPCTEGRLEISEAKRSDCGTGHEKAVVDTLEEEHAHAVVDAAEVSLEPEMNTHLVHKITSDAIEIVQEEVAASSVSTPASEKPHTSLPGTFLDATLSLKTDPVSEPQTTPPNSSVPSETPRRRRSPLEEAIARTRSPLEVALAMQLRPGLGLGADPAWMVRFMMVMWGWMFGLVLVPGVEA